MVLKSWNDFVIDENWKCTSSLDLMIKIHKKGCSESCKNVANQTTTTGICLSGHYFFTSSGAKVTCDNTHPH